MPTYDGIGSSVTHEIEVVGDVFISNVEGGSLSTQVPFEIFSNVSGMTTPPTDSRQVRLRVQPTTEASPDDSYVTDMGIQNTTDNYFFITAPQNTSNVGDQNTFVISKTSNVGIGTTNPTSTLHVVGNELITGTLTASNIVGGSPLTITSDQNLQVNSNLTVGISNLFVNNVNGRVGIGTDTPSYILHAREDVDGIAQIRVENPNSSGGRARFAMQHLSNVASIDLTNNNIFNIENNAETESLAQLRLIQKGDRPITFCTNGSANERMRIAGDGNVGIGTTNPDKLLTLGFSINSSSSIQFQSDLNIIRQSEADRDAYFSSLENSIQRYADRQTRYSSGLSYGPTHQIIFGYSDDYYTDTGDTPNTYYPKYHEIQFNVNNSTSGGSLSRVMTLRGNGNVGIGMTNPSYQLELSTNSAAKPTSSTWTATSDQRIKEDIVDANLDTCYENVKNLKLKYYKLRNDIIELDPIFKDAHKLGWIAQEVEEVLPKCVTTIPEQYGLTDVKNLDVDQIYTNLFGAVQKLIKENENLKARIESLENSS